MDKFKQFFSLDVRKDIPTAIMNRLLEGETTTAPVGEKPLENKLWKGNSMQVPITLDKAESIAKEHVHIFRIELDYAKLDLGVSNLFFFWFGKQGMLVSPDGSINLNFALDIEEHPENIIKASSCICFCNVFRQFH